MYSHNTYSLLAIFTAAMLALFLLPHQAKAQFSLLQGDSYEYYYRIMQISGIAEDPASFLVRPFMPANNIHSRHPWSGITRHQGGGILQDGRLVNFYFYEPVWFQSYNTALPRGGQDGAIWQGKGYNTALSAGVYAHAGPLHVSFRPQAGITQNREFALGPYDPPEIRTSYFRGPAGEYAYPGFRSGIDNPVRFGPDSYSWTDFGETSAELRFRGLSAGISNQRIWTGPGIHNSLQFGYNAPGFLHAHLGTYKPLQTKIGDFEFRYIFGGIRKSDFFAEEVRNIHSVNSLIAVYSPKYLNGLSVGATRTFIHNYPEDFSEYVDQATKIFEAVVRVGLQDDDNPTGYDPDNQIGSIFARWIVPDSGFEVYFEYARNDHNIDLKDFRRQPNHHRAYILGTVKSFNLEQNRLLTVGIEMMQSETPRASLTRGGGHLGGWHVHSQQVVGFTNRGQIMGTAFGPGPNTQMVFADLFDEKGRLGITLARIVYHNSRVDQYFDRIRAANEMPIERWEVRNVELMAGIRTTFFIKYGFEIETALEHSYIFNHHNLYENDLTNTRFEITIRKRMIGWLR